MSEQHTPVPGMDDAGNLIRTVAREMAEADNFARYRDDARRRLRQALGAPAAQGKKNRKWSAEERAELVRLWNEGAATSALMRRFDCSAVQLRSMAAITGARRRLSGGKGVWRWADEAGPSDAHAAIASAEGRT